MKNSIIYITLILLLSSLCSCSLEETYTPVTTEGTVEFVPRLTNFNGVNVGTKAGEDNIENAIYNAFLLIFDQASGKRVHFTAIDVTNGTLSHKVPTTAIGNSSVTACIIANVPQSFAEGIEYTTKPANATAGIDYKNKCLDTAVLDLEYSTSESNGIPILDHDNDGKNKVQAIPMFGKEGIEELAPNTEIQITVKRLFAKVKVNLSLNMNLSSWGQVVNSGTYFDLNFCNIYNMPKKVRLEQSADQSDWRSTENDFTSILTAIKNLRVYNGNSTSFELYVPEYYLDPKDDASEDQRFKPKNYPDGTYPIYLFLDAEYCQYSLNSTILQYEVYLGRDEHSDFSLDRNVNYINYLTVTGINNHDKEEGTKLDYRVTTTVINNPVAKEGKSANCYVASRKGEYTFPAYKGAYNDLTYAVLCNGDEKSEVVDLTEGKHSGITLSDLDYDEDQNMISFNITNITNGNVVIALENKDSNGNSYIEWSWHIWCSTEYWWEGMLNTDWGSLKEQTYPNNKQWADRNLGASAATGTATGEGLGLYYQYGNKNPFISDGYKGGGSNGNNTWNPASDSNTNDNTKAVNDPCPPGYKVPAITDWPTPTSLQHQSVNLADWFSDGMLFFYDHSQAKNDVYYPYSGHYNADNQKVTAITDTYLYPGSYEKEMQFTILGTGYKVKELEYTVEIDLSRYGALLSSECKTLSYEVMPESLRPAPQITKGKYCTGFLGFYGKWYDINVNSVSQELLTQVRNEIIEKDTRLKSEMYKLTKPDANTSNRYQVRCVKE